MRQFILAVLTLFLFHSGTALAQDMPTATTQITADDLITHPVGRKVKDLNERMREIGQNAEKFEKGSDSYNLLKAGFDKRKKERDKAGEDIRGLRGFEVTLYGDEAVGNPASVKQSVIDFYIRNPSQRHMQPFHVYFDKNGNGPIVTVAPPNPDDVMGEKKKKVQPSGPPVKGGDIIVITPTPVKDPYNPPDDCKCARILGQCGC
jgi:hypothetical protein